MIHGGSGTTIYRSGTPTVALNAAAETALALSLDAMDKNYLEVKKLNVLLRNKLNKIDGLTINSPNDAIPHILNISIEEIRGTAIRDILSKYGVCISVKSACSTDTLPSRAVYAVSRSRKNALSSWRISLSHLTTEQEISDFIKILNQCVKELRTK